MPTSQYARHALHCAFGSTSTISHSSVFPAALIASFDSLLKGLNARCCWRSLWSACRWGWFSIFWIKLWTLTPCDRFNHRIRHSWDVEIDILLISCKVELVRVRWCSVTMFGRNKFFHCVCACARFHRFPVPSWTCMTRMSSDSFTGFPVLSEEPSSLCKRLSSILWTGRFSFPHKNTFCVLRFPRSITDWIGFGLGWFGEFI